MIVGVVTVFEMTFKGDSFKVAGKVMILFPKFQYLKKKICCGPLKNSGEQSRAILALLFTDREHTEGKGENAG